MVTLPRRVILAAVLALIVGAAPALAQSPLSYPPVQTATESTFAFSASGLNFDIALPPGTHGLVLWWGGTFLSAGTITFAGSTDNATTYVTSALTATRIASNAASTVSSISPTIDPAAARAFYFLPVGGFDHVRLTSAGTWSSSGLLLHAMPTQADPRTMIAARQDGVWTVTGAQGTATAVANAWPIEVTDATNTAAVKAASTAAATTDPALVVGLSPNSPLPAGTNVIGHVVADSGSTTAVTSLPANASVNETQVNGVALSVGQGISDTGTQRVTQSQELTYAASTTLKTATASGTGPFFSVCGSASKTISIQRIAITGTTATAAYGDLALRKTSTATSGGTATTLTAAPFDSTSAAATAVAKYYTVLATAGTSVGTILSVSAYFPLTATVGTFGPQLIYTWRDPDAQPPVLRGTAQCLEASFGTAPGSVPTLSVSVAWTEK